MCISDRVWVALIVFAVLKLIVPAARFRPRLTDMALRVEKARPEVRGLMASAIDFAEHGDVSAGADPSELSKARERLVVRRSLTHNGRCRRANPARSRRAPQP